MDSEGRASKINTSFNDVTQSMEEDPLVEGPLISPHVLDSDIKSEFQKLPTWLFAFLLSFLHVAFVILSIVLAVFCSIREDNTEECKRYLQDFKTKTVIVISKVALWLLHAVFEQFVQHHHSRTRNRGYLQFYRSTRNLKHLPLFIHSAGNAGLLLVLSMKLSFPTDNHLYMYIILGLLGLELCFSIPCLIIYTVKVINFNKEKPGPDISQEERSNAYPSRRSLINTETGFRDCSSLEEVVEKQADLIEYLKQRNSLLSKRILSLTSQQHRD